MFDLNDAAPQMGPMGELIPDGSFVKVLMTIKPGGTNGAVEADAGLLKASKTSDAKMLDCEFVVIGGPFNKRHFWGGFVVDGGKRNDKGESIGWNISKSSFRAMIESAIGLDPNDMSDAAKSKRSLRALKDLNGITFAARVMIEPASNPNYKDQNKLANIVLPNEEQYAAIMAGQDVAPVPVNAKPRQAPAAGGGGAPSWQGGQTGQQPAGDMPAWASE